MSERLTNSVAAVRAAAGLSQRALADRVGLSRQALSAIETGHCVPSTAIALRLAAALGRRVDDLFRYDDAPRTLRAELADPSGGAPLGSRVALASVRGKRVAHVLAPGSPLSNFVAADGLLQSRDGAVSSVELLCDVSAPDQTLVCAGCAPALGILTAQVARARGSRMLWVDAPSTTALELLRDGHVHVAGAHLFDVESGQYNVPFARQLLPERALHVVELARWEVGLVLPKGNPRRVQNIDDLVRMRLRVIPRTEGSGARQLLSRLLAEARIPENALELLARAAESHLDVARAVALGIADAGVAIVGAARALGQDFVPLGAERFDLIYDAELRDDARLAQLLDTLTSAKFSHELASIGGYDLGDAGRLIAQTAAA